MRLARGTCLSERGALLRRGPHLSLEHLSGVEEFAALAFGPPEASLVEACGRTIQDRFQGNPSRNGLGTTDCVYEQMRSDGALKAAFPNVQVLVRNYLIRGIEKTA